VIRKTVHFMFCILFLIAILSGCAKSTEIVTMPPPPTNTQVSPTPTLEPSPTESSVTQIAVIERVSVASDGTQGNADSWSPAISADGCYVAFSSYASNLVEGDTNGVTDIFVHDRVTGETTRVSVASDGTEANKYNEAIRSFISADGRYVAFRSDATNLVEGDTNGVMDCFVHDLVTGETTRVSVASDGTQSNGDCGRTFMVLIYGPSISADGRFVAFSSWATNLVEGFTEYVNIIGYTNIYVHDLVTGETTLESVSSDGTQGNNSSSFLTFSADGRYVRFSSDATNLVEGVTHGGIFVHDRMTGETTLEAFHDGTQRQIYYSIPAISADGRYEAFESGEDNLVKGDTDGVGDIFVRDLGTNK